MERQCVLVSGSNVANDELLIDELRKDVTVLRNSDNSLISTIINNTKVDLVLFEISNDASSGVIIIDNVKTQYPNIKIIVIDGSGNRELVSESFSYGADDAFRSPYKGYLIVERVKAILSKLNL